MRFAIVTRDELWERGGLREHRLSHGEAVTRGDEILATDTLDEELLARCPPFPPGRRWREAGPDEGRVRKVQNARRAGNEIITETTIIVTVNDRSIVTTPEHLEADRKRLQVLSPQLSIDYRDFPIVWRDGTAAVLLHEAAGHPAEHRKTAVNWPAWLSVRDEPHFETDDSGRRTRPVDLLRGEKPSAMRRATFTDVPLPRLSNVVVRHTAAPFGMPERRIQVQLIGGGNYDPLTDLVRIHVTAADFVEGDRSRPLEPFVIEESRASVAAAMRGAGGDLQRYPGVVCSSEGQEIVVGSHAPILLTRF